jgi:autotransporter-associated beta strand protein
VADSPWDVLGINFAAGAGGFSNSGSALTIRSDGITNNSSALQRIANSITMAAPQFWNSAVGPISLDGLNNNGGFLLTVDGGSSVSFSSGGLSGAGGLTKNGAGTLTLNAVMTFSGPITLNAGAIETTTDNVLTNQSLTLNAGTVSALSKSQTLGSLTLAGNAAINLDPGNGSGVLIFSSATRSAGTLTINGWVGVNGHSGRDDKIRILSDPGVEFLNAIRFTGFSAGAIRLADGEIVPPSVSVWDGLGLSDNWSNPSNWVALLPPLTDGSASLIFDGNNRLTPVTDLPWNIFDLTFAGSAGSFSNSGSQLTIRSTGVGIANNGTALQTIANNVVLGGPQTWNAVSGPLAFRGSNNNGGFTLTINGSANVTLAGGLGGSGGLTKSGSGSLSISAPMTLTGLISLNGGTLETTSSNVFANQDLTLNGGTLSLLSKSQTFSVLTLATNSSITLEPGNGVGILSFVSASAIGGRLTITGWSGVAGQSGTDDKIFVTANPGAGFLSAVRFTGFAPGALYLPSGEIVPPAVSATPPTLSSPIRVSPTQFQFTISGSAGQSYTVQRSATLTNWTSILTTNAPSNLFNVIDLSASNSLGFYRVFTNP